MTTQAIVMNIRPDVIPDNPALATPDVPVASWNGEYVADAPEVHNAGADVGEEFWMYLQLRATPERSTSA